jgi:hypothetical protein
MLYDKGIVRRFSLWIGWDLTGFGLVGQQVLKIQEDTITKRKIGSCIIYH